MFLCSQNKGADQLCGYSEAYVGLCVCICKIRFSHYAAHFQLPSHACYWTVQTKPGLRGGHVLFHIYWLGMVHSDGKNGCEEMVYLKWRIARDNFVLSSNDRLLQQRRWPRVRTGVRTTEMYRCELEMP